MLIKSNIYSVSDTGIVKIIGEFIRHHRLAQNKTQAALADEAGMNRSTLVEFEKGKQVNLLTLIQLLRVLHQLHVLNEFVVKMEPSPIQLAELEVSKRKRASALKKKGKRKSDW